MAAVLTLSTMHSTKHSLHEEMLVEIPHNHQDNRLPALLVRRKTTTWLQCRSGTLLHRPSSCFSAEITPGQEGTMGSVEAGTHHFSSCHSTCSLSAVAQQKLHPVRTESWGQSRTRTYNPRLRRPMPYPLGHRTCAGPKPETRHFSSCHHA